MEFQETPRGRRLRINLSEDDVAHLNRQFAVSIVADDDGYVAALKETAGITEVRLVVEVT